MNQITTYLDEIDARRSRASVTGATSDCSLHSSAAIRLRKIASHNNSPPETRCCPFSP